MHSKRHPLGCLFFVHKLLMNDKRGILAAQLALQALGTYEVRAVGLSCHLCSPESRSLICWRMPWVLVNALWMFDQIRFAL